MSQRAKTTEFLAGAGLLLTTVIWGFAFVVVKNSLDLIPPIYMLAFRFTIASLALALLYVRRLRRLDLALCRNGAVLGLFLFLAYVLQTIGCKYTTAGKNAFLTTVYVVLVPFLGWALLKKRPAPRSVPAALLAMVGIGLLSLQGDLRLGLGDGLTLLCGVAFALHILYIGRYAARQDPVLLTLVQLAVAALLSWLLAPLLEGGFPEAALHPSVVGGMLYLGLFSTMLGFLLQNVGQKYVRPAPAAVLLSTESLFGVVFSTLLLHESLSPRMWLGCGLIFLAVLLSETGLGLDPLLERLGGRKGRNAAG